MSLRFAFSGKWFRYASFTLSTPGLRAMMVGAMAACTRMRDARAPATRTLSSSVLGTMFVRTMVLRPIFLCNPVLGALALGGLLLVLLAGPVSAQQGGAVERARKPGRVGNT